MTKITPAITNCPNLKGPPGARAAAAGRDGALVRGGRRGDRARRAKPVLASQVAPGAGAGAALVGLAAWIRRRHPRADAVRHPHVPGARPVRAPARLRRARLLRALGLLEPGPHRLRQGAPAPVPPLHQRAPRGLRRRH